MYVLYRIRYLHIQRYLNYIFVQHLPGVIDWMRNTKWINIFGAVGPQKSRKINLRMAGQLEHLGIIKQVSVEFMPTRNKNTAYYIIILSVCLLVSFWGELNILQVNAGNNDRSNKVHCTAPIGLLIDTISLKMAVNIKFIVGVKSRSLN